MKAHALLLAAFLATYSASAGDFDFDLGEDLTGEDIEEAIEEESCDSSLIATQVGRNTFFSDGESATTVGKNTFFSDGTVATRVGRNTFFSNGETATTVGKNTFFSDGTVATKVGRNTFFTDGTVATEVGKNTFISGGDCESRSEAAVLSFGEE
jgi:hypothetical protein